MKTPFTAIILTLVFVVAATASGRSGTKAANDAFHIDWDAFCATHASNCDGGNPHYAPGDAGMIANTLPVKPWDDGITHVCTSKHIVTGNDNCAFVVGVYEASASDPLVTVHLHTYKGGTNVAGTGALDGSAIRIPRGAMPQPAADGHLNVRQPGGVMCELWRVNFNNSPHPPGPGPVTRPDVDAAAGTCGLSDSGAYAARIDITDGLVRAEDLAGSNGDGTDSKNPFSLSHALYGSFDNNHVGMVWPARANDGQCTTRAGGGALPLEGMVLYLDTAGYEIVKRWSPPSYLRPLQRFLGNVHKHGMIDLDSGGCSEQNRYVGLLTWGPQEAFQRTGTSLFDTYLKREIEPNDARYIGQMNGPETAITMSGDGQYVFHMLDYQDVPGLGPANFHWLNLGCAQLAAQGSSDHRC